MQAREKFMSRIFILEPAFSKREEVAFLERREEELFDRLKKEVSEDAANILMEYSDVVTLLCIEAERHFYKCGLKDAGLKAFLQACISQILE